MQQSKRRQAAGVTARTRGDCNQTVRSLVDGFPCEHVVDHIVQHNPAIGMHGAVHVLARTKRSNGNGHLVSRTQFEVALQPVVRLVHDLVDCERSGRPLRMPSVVLGEFGRDALQPLFQQRFSPGVKGRKRADNASLALRNHEVGVGNDEQWRADHRQRKAAFEQGG